MEKGGGHRDLRKDSSSSSSKTVVKKNAATFKEGAKIEAKDHQGNQWWEAKVIEVDSEHSEVLVHFIGWNERHDEWIKMDSPRLQPANRNSRRHSGTDSPAQKGPNPGTAAHVKEFKTGEEVMALWAKNTKYPAKIIRFEPDGSYLVEFYDGFKKHLRPQNIRRIQSEDLLFIAACKEDVKLFKAGYQGRASIGDRVQESEDDQLPATASSADPPNAAQAPQTSGGTGVASLPVEQQRRERKSKFSVKDIFNFRKQSVSSASEGVVNNFTAITTTESSGDSCVAAKGVGKSAAGGDAGGGSRRSSALTKISLGQCENKSVDDVLLVLHSDSDGDLCSSEANDRGQAAKADVTSATGPSRGGGLQARRRGVGRPTKRNKEEGDRNGNSPQGAADPCVNCDISPTKEQETGRNTPAMENRLAVVAPVGPQGDTTTGHEHRSGTTAEKTIAMSSFLEKPSELPSVVDSLPCNSPVAAGTIVGRGGRGGEGGENMLELDGSISRDSIQSGLHNSEVVDTGSEGTPSEKENLPTSTSRQQLLISNDPSPAKVNSVRPRLSSTLFKDSNGVMPTPGGDSSVSNKRSRKRKRFADEEPETSNSNGPLPLILHTATSVGGCSESLTKVMPGGKPPARGIGSRAKEGETSPTIVNTKARRSPTLGMTGASGRNNSTTTVLSPKKLPLQKSRSQLVPPTAAVCPASSSLAVNATPVKKSHRARPPVNRSSGGSCLVATSVNDNKDSVVVTSAYKAAASADGGDTPRSGGKGKAAPDASGLLSAPVLELGPSNNNVDKKSVLVSVSRDEVKSPSRLLSNGDDHWKADSGSAAPDLYSYLRFDFSLPSSELASRLIEGRNIPGTGRPILMEAPKLPPGWTKKVTVRTNGVNVGKWDVLIENPAGQSFKSKQDLSRHFEANDLKFNIEDFDFMLDPILKRLRQIWKATQSTNSNRSHLGQQTPAMAAADSSGGSSLLGSGCVIPYELLGSTPPVASPDLKQTEGVASSRFRTSVGSGASTVPHKLSTRSERVSPQHQPPPTPPSSSLGIDATPASSLPGETGLTEGGAKSRGVRCPLKNCDKLFRSEYLLMMHVKHYHSHYYHLVGNSPSVTDLAFHRTRLGESLDKEFETGGEILEALRKAEAREEKRQLQQGEGGDSQSSSTGICSVRNNRSSTRSQQTPAQPEPNISATPTTRGSGPPNKRKLSPGNGDRPTVSGRAAATVKRLKVSEEERGELSISIPNATTGMLSPPEVADISATKRGSSVSTAVLSPLPGTVVEGVDAALPSTPLTSTGASTGSGGAAGARGCSKADSIILDSYQVAAASRLRQDSVMSVSSSEGGGAAAAGAGGSTPPASPASANPPQWRRRRLRTPPSEFAPSVPDPEPEVMSEEEIVVCLCGRMEGDGLMVQCDLCLTWQHGSCLNIFTEDQVPEKYICATCQNPRLGRSSQLHRLDHDWIKEGLLPSSSPTSQQQQLQHLGRLMTELTALSSVLHALQVKLGVAEQATHPKVFMWSAPWEEEEDAEEEGVWPHQDAEHCDSSSLLQPQPGLGQLSFPPHDQNSLIVAAPGGAFPSPADCLVGEASSSGGGTTTVDGPTTTSCDNAVNGSSVGKAEASMASDTRTQTDAMSLAIALAEGQTETQSVSADSFVAGTSSDFNDGKKESEGLDPRPPPAAGGEDSIPPSSSSPVFNSHMQHEAPGSGDPSVGPAAVDPFFFDFPSLNEVKELLPSVLKDISSLEDLTNHHPGSVTTAGRLVLAAAAATPAKPPVTIIPEPKLINREESRLNLISHIEHLQELVEQRLDLVEQRLEGQEEGQAPSPDCSNIVQAVARLLTDIQSMKKANAMLPDRI